MTDSVSGVDLSSGQLWFGSYICFRMSCEGSQTTTSSSSSAQDGVSAILAAAEVTAGKREKAPGSGDVSSKRVCGGACDVSASVSVSV